MAIGDDFTTFGFYTPGVPLFTNGLPAAARIPCDTGLEEGASPQSAAIIPGTLPAPSTQIGLTAQADGTKANATVLGYGVNTLTTVAGAADSVLLPYAFPGAVCVVINTTATAAQAFGKGTDEIDDIATATGVSIAATERATFYGSLGAGDGTDAGNWYSSIGAVA